MYQYKKLEHPADIKILVKADNLKDLFKGSALALKEILFLKDLKNKEKKEKVEKEIWINSLDSTSLLIDFLNQILTFSDIENAVFDEIEIKKLTETEIFATIKGGKIEKFDQEIKAVTYHQSEIKKINGFYQTIIIFDI